MSFGTFSSASTGNPSTAASRCDICDKIRATMIWKWSINPVPLWINCIPQHIHSNPDAAHNITAAP